MDNCKAIVFDAYGTLFDVHTVTEKCELIFPRLGGKISNTWRQKQLEYTWLRSLMGRYEDFWEVTRDALVFTLKEQKVEWSDEALSDILNEYLHLKPYNEVPAALGKLQVQGKQLAVLSNGTPHMLQSVIRHAGLASKFSYVISVDERKIFKPFMDVYQLAPDKLGVHKEEVLFISSNPWDVSGAKVFGFQVCWINRFDKQFDELGVEPDVVVRTLDELAEKLQREG
ncbi:haloacid dehalogenase type II [Aneurinibacillus tyrosinisolvens]|uniref:haloacid dehalogenase type II n=1 Tax=Aneurinibacillus tyrosinisolvens TaxID=1443435 RepID=UPI00063FAE1F|nr:haloacid dehalogenase type II [Aneurinibacillus tyrosinisolvens]